MNHEFNQVLTACAVMVHSLSLQRRWLIWFISVILKITWEGSKTMNNLYGYASWPTNIVDSMVNVPSFYHIRTSVSKSSHLRQFTRLMFLLVYFWFYVAICLNFARGFSFTTSGSPFQCEDLTISWTGEFQHVRTAACSIGYVRWLQVARLHSTSSSL
jgi:hypothetical protein